MLEGGEGGELRLANDQGTMILFIDKSLNLVIKFILENDLKFSIV